MGDPVGGACRVAVLTAAGVQIMALGEVYADPIAAYAALADRVGHLERRLALLEARPEEVVPFTGSLTTGILAVGTKAFTISGVAGLLAGDRIVVEPVAAMPAGLSIAGSRVPADGTVEVTIAAVVALPASKTIALAITALR